MKQKTISPSHLISVILHQEKTGGFWAESTEFPRVYSQGETVDETLHNFIDAVLTHLEIPSHKPQPPLRLEIRSSPLVMETNK